MCLLLVIGQVHHRFYELFLLEGANIPSTLRNSSLPPSKSLQSNTTAQFPAIIPLSASPAYSILHPYPLLPLQEEVSVECAMRDQHMADVNVTSPGV
jgi:hypothetical protein